MGVLKNMVDPIVPGGSAAVSRLLFENDLKWALQSLNKMAQDEAIAQEERIRALSQIQHTAESLLDALTE